MMPNGMLYASQHQQEAALTNGTTLHHRHTTTSLWQMPTAISSKDIRV